MNCITNIFKWFGQNTDAWAAIGAIAGILVVLAAGINWFVKFSNRLFKKNYRNHASIKTYKECIKKENSHLDAEKLFGEQAFPLSLPEIFIPLYANDPEIKQKQGRQPMEREMAEKQEPVDIEELIGKYDRLAIEGHAGSGKTTVLKHVAYSLVVDNNYAKEKKMENFLPVLIYLKYLNEYFAQANVSAKSVDILKWYLINKLENCLEYEVLEGLIKQGRVMFLLDGLDELKPEYRNPLIDTFINLQINNNKNKLVFSGRPHGITENLVNKFESRHVKVNDLNELQINEFIRKWFKYLYKGETASGKKTGESLIGDIKDNAATEQLKSNPLMLTAICILYHDDRELPAQRAELYKKFIDNMLYRRFGNNYKKVLEYLELLACGMHEKGVRTTGNDFALQKLSEVFPKEEGEKESDFRTRIQEKFEDIEPKCGLLKFENGEYSFWHLSFQEYC